MSTSTTLTTTPTTYDAMFALLRSTLWGEERFPFTLGQDSPLDWKEIYKELSWHTVRVLPTDLFCRLDAAHQQKYMMNSSFCVSIWYSVMEAQKLLCEQLNETGIPFVILKGAASARYYPKPTYRQMGDIDFLVPPAYFEQAHQLLLNEGYHQLNTETHRHLEFQKDNVLFELHRAFAAFKEPERVKFLDNLIFEAFERLETATVEGYSFPVLPPIEIGLVLLEHINQHLESGLGLRQIIDWALYVDRFLTDTAWEHDFSPIVRQLGLESLAIAVTRMCQLYLGLRTDITWCGSAEDDVCHQLMEYIMEQGNFGRKGDTCSHKTVNALNAMQNIPGFFQRLQHSGLNIWPALKKYPRLKPILAPFAWFWQLCRYVRLSLKREQPFKSLMMDIKKSRHKDDLMEALGVNQSKKGISTPDGMIY